MFQGTVSDWKAVKANTGKTVRNDSKAYNIFNIISTMIFIILLPKTVTPPIPDPDMEFCANA